MVMIRRPSTSKTKSGSQKIQIAAPILTLGLCLIVVLTTTSPPSNPLLFSAAKDESLLSQAAVENGDNGPIVETSSGKIRGKIEESRDGRTYSAFYQIPYAEPPNGAYRFQAPRPYNSTWSDIRDGTRAGDSNTACIQFKRDTVEGVEDCLYLSVFTPKLPRGGRRNSNLPVMVYILGGAFLFGRANRYGAQYLMDEDVVLVLVEFRVGSFGHLNTEDSEIRGNQAFKDQVMALRWVQREIANFGGDKKRVLIFGNSSGSASVHALIISPMTDGLFSVAVSQSGTVVLPPGPATRPLDSARQLGQKLNCTNVENTTGLHQCLLQADAKDIAAVELDDMLFISKDGGVSENQTDFSQVFMPDYPINLLRSGQFKKIPWLVGCNSAESYMSAYSMLAYPPIVAQLNKIWQKVAPPLLKFTDDLDHNASRSIRQQYFGSQQIGNETRQNFTNLLSDSEWVHPITVAARYHAQFGGKAYLYWLTKEPSQSYGDKAKGDFEPPFGVGHGDEVQYFFPFDPFPYISAESDHYQFSKSIIREWAQFARNGKPSKRNWRPLTENFSRSKWMELNDRFKPMEPLADRMTFLDNFPFDHPTFMDYGQ